ncbi:MULTISPECIES: type I DNA topoisomerase [unclassified Fusibacter]|uniref:type I DNA topoisomerase n=1 Tax=unclassified Fusibacter TaxID=2624464 RepID=UPI0010107206|nr:MULTISPECIES: type I DNA topoisomerase [unclassified Fusibacter]MCK8058749.1 type I DNA topoisomerase [Fusibacter sp. A2]NPE21823.1 type I DNA topoisomerase [Fusibacter sp. A1]RXV61395.1 type I DNA topoisomerase [Fusibacter sp. A1]
MSKFLVIVESPAKAKTIGKFLGRNYKVKASVGHVRDLPKSKMGIDIEDNYEPQYITIRGKGEVIKELKAAAKKADKIYLATDPDREGEAIAWHLQTLLEKQGKTFHRIAFNAITKDAVKGALKEARDIDMNLVDAQQARRVLDRLVGYSISPILWRKIRRGLSAGRVQSVATRMICDRENEIEKFENEEYWTIKGDFKSNDSKFEAMYYGLGSEKTALPNEEAVQKVLGELSDEFLVESVVKKAKRRQAYAPFITSSLQQEAATRYGFSTKKTMMLAQQLYEGVQVSDGTVGLITYMRTDSTRIAPEASDAILAFIDETYGSDYKGKVPKSKTNKNAQDAHEAIRPSYVERTPESLEKYLTKDQLKLYQLIWERAVASHMTDAVFDQTSIVLNNQGHTFKASGSIMNFDGFLKVYSFTKTKESLLPEIEEGTSMSASSIEPEQHFTQPPARYTEASLVKAMEELGIGRPSTYAPTISTILSRGYIEREKKALKPTELGALINDIMVKYFDKIVDVGFTASMEQQLDEVEANGTQWKNIIAGFYGDFKSSLDHAEEELEKIDVVEVTDEICNVCGSQMVIKYGRFGKFLACANYPECEHTRPLLKRIGVKCPVCKEGDVIERKTKKFKNFYGCSAFPDCNFMSWHRPTGDPCPTCGDPLIEYKTKRKHEISCLNKECDYKKAIAQEE